MSRSSRGMWVLLGLALALGLAIYAGLQGRHGADAALKRATEEAAIPTVVVVKPAGSVTCEVSVSATGLLHATLYDVVRPSAVVCVTSPGSNLP